MRPRALVTGATGGLGGALAELLAAEGHDLMLAGRREGRLTDRAEALAARYGISVETVALDLAAPGAAEALLAATAAHAPDVAALAAAGYAHGALADADPDRLNALAACNVVATGRLLRGLLARMDARGSGRVLVVGSLGAASPAPWHAAYSASKAWLHQLVRSLQAERGGAPVTITLLCPGGLETPMLLDSPAWADLRRNPLARASVMSPERAARAALDGLRAGRALVVPGWINRLALLAARMLPAGLQIALSRWLYRPGGGSG